MWEEQKHFCLSDTLLNTIGHFLFIVGYKVINKYPIVFD